MVKRIFFVLVLVYLSYSFWIYCYSSKPGKTPPDDALKGFALWQSKNCQGCHQLYGLGGYMGPDLTNLMSDPAKGPVYAYAFIKSGTQRMPDLKLSDGEISQVVAFLSWVDQSGKAFVPADKVTWLGNYKSDRN